MYKAYSEFCIALCCSLFICPCFSQVITTLAGNGSASFSCTGGPGTSASFSPRSLAIDAKGNLYVADSTEPRVCKITTEGLISIVAGNEQAGFSGDGGPAINASLDGPRGLATDAAGNLYIADAGNDRVRKVDIHGVITTVAGNEQQGFSGDGGPAIRASLSRPNGVAVDAAGNLFIADTANHRVRKVDLQGIITTMAGNGQQGFSGDGGPATSASLRHPDAVALDANKNLYIADTNNMAIRKVNPANIISTVAGNSTPGFSGDGGPGVKASLSFPGGLTVDAAGNLYIADTGNSRIRKVSRSGIIATVAGNGRTDFSGDGCPPTAASLHNPHGVVVDATGNLLIADTFNFRIRKVGLPKISSHR